MISLKNGEINEKCKKQKKMFEKNNSFSKNCNSQLPIYVFTARETVENKRSNDRARSSHMVDEIQPVQPFSGKTK